MLRLRSVLFSVPCLIRPTLGEMIKGNREDMKGLRGASVCNRIPENDTSPSKKINKSFCPNSRNFRIFYVNGKRELRVQMELKLLIGWP